MYRNQKIVVVMPAYNAESTLLRTYHEVMAQGVVDHVVIVDDCSSDATARIAAGLPASELVRHQRNLGYGANQKSCYRRALRAGADIVIMVHPDYQYTPRLIPVMAAMIGSGLYDCVLASRILGGRAREGGMPGWKYAANRILTLLENLLLGTKLSEFHTGYRAFSASLLKRLPLHRNSDDFVFDNQILAQIHALGYLIGEVSCPTKYFPEASSINFWRSLQYGLGCLLTAARFRLHRWRLLRSWLFTYDA
ncbi:MAG TPA: glycosyltransferase family 2 protein [Proteobacteria bacterium]|nr:glycosyltransferase family 2 protein [Pseudomonadota bacterium]